MTLDQGVINTPSETRILNDADADAVRKLFKEVFNQDMSAEFWRWKYRAPGGCAVGVFKNGELVAHYGGVGATILFKGKPARALQVVDVMVKVAVRKAVRTQSPFFLAGKMFLENFIGYAQPYLVGYGFPSNRHMGIAEHLGLYAPVGRMAEISWKLDEQMASPAFWYKSAQVTPANFGSYQKTVDHLWRQFSAEMQDYIVVQKDAAFVEHRYLRNPDVSYTILLMTARLTGKPLGMIVLKTEVERVLLMDIIGPFAKYPLLLQLAKWQTIQLGKRQLSTWCSEIFVERLMDDSATSTTLPIITPANIWTAGPAPEELHNRWWLTPGDTDFL